jgi:N-acetylglucosamine-6-phosphate deacetylase
MTYRSCKKRLSWPDILLLLISLVFCCAVTASAETISKVEGIFYTDSKPVSVEIVDDRISKIIHKDKLDDANNADLYLAPGLIDHQVNGYVSVNFVGPQLSVEDVRKATIAIWKKGVTTYLPTLTTNTRELLTKNFAVVAQAAKDPQIADSIAGFHLEGPYISPVEGYRGAHNEQWIRPPDWNEFLEFYKAADNKILEVTIAPETPGAIDFIRNCRKLGVIVAIGHTAADAEQIRQAVEAGAAVSTHLGNGCANMIHRHENPLWPQLADDRLTASIVCDGLHLPPEQVRTFFKVKGPQRTIIVSDMSSLAGMPPGEYTRHGRKVVVTPEGLIKMPSQDVLAGSSMPISVGIGNVMKFTGCSLADAIQMASTNPARLLHLDDRGQIEPGKRADIILFRCKDNTLSIQKTIIAGKIVYSAQ